MCNAFSGSMCTMRTTECVIDVKTVVSEGSTSRAPYLSAHSMVERVSRIRASSVTRPSSSSGTLKSTRMKTRLPLSSRSLMDSLAMRSSLQAFLAHEIDEIANTARVAPFVVIPRDNFHAVAADNQREQGIHDGRARIAFIV